jgi:hypothetical protein
LNIAPNTVSKVYRELVAESWLIERPGSRHVVVERKIQAHPKTEYKGLEDLINHTIRLAQEHGFSLQQLAGRLREHLFEQPPDHLLIVEPEREMGHLMREEIRQETGQVAAGCSIGSLRHNPSLAIGAMLLTPSYLEDGLGGLPFGNHRIVRLTYLPADSHLGVVRNLRHPSAVGMLSISPSALKTAAGVLAPAIGERHTLHELLMEWPIGKEGPRFKHYSPKQHPPRPPVRHFNHIVSTPGAHSLDSSQDTPPLFAAELDFIDILFCDSIVYEAIKHCHRRSVRCQLLSDDSLKAVVAAAKSLTRDLHHLQQPASAG